MEASIAGSNHASIPISPPDFDVMASNLNNSTDNNNKIDYSHKATKRRIANGANKSTKKTVTNRRDKNMASSKGIGAETVIPGAFIHPHIATAPPAGLPCVPLTQMQVVQGAANAAMPFYHPMNLRLEGGYAHGHPHGHPHFQPIALQIPTKPHGTGSGDMPAVNGKPQSSKKKVKGRKNDDIVTAIPSLPVGALPIYPSPFPAYTYDGRPIMHPAAFLQFQRRLQQQHRAPVDDEDGNKSTTATRDEEKSSSPNVSVHQDASMDQQRQDPDDLETSSITDRQDTTLHHNQAHPPPFALHPFPGFPVFHNMIAHPNVQHDPSGLSPFGSFDFADAPSLSVAQMQQLFDRQISPIALAPLPQQAPPPKKRKQSAEAKQRRKERNKLLARRTRQRKKVETEALRDQFITTLLENQKLRQAVKEKLDTTISETVLANAFELPVIVKEFLKGILTAHQKALLNEITSKQRSFCIVDPHSNQNKITHVSEGFCKLTGYTPQECIGRNCRFLQGPQTDPVVTNMMSEHLKSKQDFVATLLNYRKNGDMFWNKLEIHHCFDENNEVAFIVGVQTECDDNYIFTRWARRRSTELLMRKDDEIDEDEGDDSDQDDQNQDVEAREDDNEDNQNERSTKRQKKASSSISLKEDGGQVDKRTIAENRSVSSSSKSIGSQSTVTTAATNNSDSMSASFSHPQLNSVIDLAASSSASSLNTLSPPSTSLENEDDANGNSDNTGSNASTGKTTPVVDDNNQ